MNIEDRYIEAAMSHATNALAGDPRSADAAADTLALLREALYATEDRGEGVLLRLVLIRAFQDGLLDTFSQSLKVSRSPIWNGSSRQLGNRRVCCRDGFEAVA